MRRRNLWGLLAIATVAAASTTASSSAETARPSLSLVQRAPLVVAGAHFGTREVVRLTASSNTATAVARTTTTRRGQLVVHFTHFAVPDCVRVVVRAVGRRGDRAALVIDPRPGLAGIPCRV